jgi:hypothetical protein
MRTLTAPLAFGAALVLTGCNHWPGLRTRDGGDARVAAPAQGATTAGLVAYLNDNARKVQAVECRRVAMDCKQGGQSVGLDGLLVCQKPRNFRLKAKVVGQPAVDIGSNDQEFWYWISKAEPPYVFHCSYAELAKGDVRMPFPFQPDMIVAALGIAEYDPDKPYELRTTPTSYELIEQTTSPQGQPVQKITVFNRVQVSGNRPQVTGHVLKDARGQVVCAATVQEVQRDRQTGAVLPFDVRLVYPLERAEMKLRLYDLQAVSLDRQRAERLFSRADLAGIQDFDLSRLRNGGVQQAGATGQ